MRKLFLLIFILPIVLAGAYAGLVLGQHNSTTSIVKLLGPGNNPKLCFERATSNFEILKPEITKIAKKLLANSKLNGVKYYAWSEQELWIEDAQKYSKKASAEEIDDYLPLFESFEKNYYFPFSFDKRNEFILVRSTAQCGYSKFEWVLLQLNIFPNWMKTKSPVADTFYIYEPQQIRDEYRACTEVIPKNELMYHCEEPISERWLWSVEWWNVEKIEESLPASIN